MSAQFLTRILRWGVYVLPLTVLVYYSKTIHPFVTLKTTLFEVLIGILFLIWLLLVTQAPEYRPRLTKLHIALLLFLSTLTVSSLFGVDLGRSLWGNQARGTGLILLLGMYVMYLILASLRPQFDWQRYLEFNLYVSGVAAAEAFTERIFPNLFYITGGDRSSGAFGNPSHLAAYLIIAIFIGLWLTWKSWQERAVIATPWKFWLLGAVTILDIAGLLITKTRGATFGFGVGALILVGYLAWQKRSKPLLGGLIFLLLLGGLMFATSKSAFWQKIPGVDRLVGTLANSDSAVGNRIIAWRSAVRAFKDRPILGWGVENFKYGFDAHYDPQLFRSGFAETYFDKPHNVFLEILVTGGSIGFIAFLAFLGVLFWLVLSKAPTEFRPFGISLLIAYLVQNFFIFDSLGSYLLFFIFVAFVDSFSVKPETASGMRRPQFNYLLIVPALITLYALFTVGKIAEANMLQWETLNYFANYVRGFNLRTSGVAVVTDIFEFPKKAFAAYRAGAAINQPYALEFKANYLTALADSIQQAGIAEPVPMIDQILADFTAELEKKPLDYFMFVSLADAKTVFYGINPKYLAGAEEDLARAETLSPNRQQTRLVAAKIKLLRGDAKGAYAEMQRAIDLDPLSGDPHFYFGLLAFQKGDLQIGFREIEEAAKLGRGPRNAREDRLLGGVYADSDQYEKARAYFEEAVKLEPDDLETRMKLGITAYYTGHNDEAREQFEYVLPKIPEFKKTPNYQELKPIFDQLGVKE